MIEILYGSVGVLLMLMAVPLMRRRVPRNGVYGVRFAAALADDRIWYEANALGGRDFFVLGAAIVAVAVWLSGQAGIPEPGRSLILTSATVTGVLLVGLISWLRVRRLAAGHRVAPGDDPSPGDRLRGR